MHDLLVNRGTNRERKTVVAVESRKRTGVPDHLVGSVVDFERRNPGLNHLAKVAQHFAHQPSRGAHLVDFPL